MHGRADPGCRAIHSSRTSLSAEEAVERRTRFTARLCRLLEERRVDVLMTLLGRHDGRAVVAAAREQGIELART